MLACMLIRNARIWPGDCPVTDVRITGGRVAERAPGLRARPGEADLDAAGGALLPGLHDHHIHLRALAIRTRSGSARMPACRIAAPRQRALAAVLPSGPGSFSPGDSPSPLMAQVPMTKRTKRC